MVSRVNFMDRMEELFGESIPGAAEVTDENRSEYVILRTVFKSKLDTLEIPSRATDFDKAYRAAWFSVSPEMATKRTKSLWKEWDVELTNVGIGEDTKESFERFLTKTTDKKKAITGNVWPVKHVLNNTTQHRIIDFGLDGMMTRLKTLIPHEMSDENIEHAVGLVLLPAVVAMQFVGVVKRDIDSTVSAFSDAVLRYCKEPGERKRLFRTIIAAHEKMAKLVETRITEKTNDINGCAAVFSFVAYHSYMSHEMFSELVGSVPDPRIVRDGKKYDAVLADIEKMTKEKWQLEKEMEDADTERQKIEEEEEREKIQTAPAPMKEDAPERPSRKGMKRPGESSETPLKRSALSAKTSPQARPEEWVNIMTRLTELAELVLKKAEDIEKKEAEAAELAAQLEIYISNSKVETCLFVPGWYCERVKTSGTTAAASFQIMLAYAPTQGILTSSAKSWYTVLNKGLDTAPAISRGISIGAVATAVLTYSRALFYMSLRDSERSVLKSPDAYWNRFGHTLLEFIGRVAGIFDVSSLVETKDTYTSTLMKTAVTSVSFGLGVVTMRTLVETLIKKQQMPGMAKLVPEIVFVVLSSTWSAFTTQAKYASSLKEVKRITAPSSGSDACRVSDYRFLPGFNLSRCLAPERITPRGSLKLGQGGPPVSVNGWILAIMRASRTGIVMGPALFKYRRDIEMVTNSSSSDRVKRLLKKLLKEKILRQTTRETVYLGIGLIDIMTGVSASALLYLSNMFPNGANWEYFLATVIFSFFQGFIRRQASSVITNIYESITT